MNSIKLRRLPAFTLVELLIVIAVIGLMASMITYALLGAQSDARAAKTRGTIQKLSEVVLQQWEEFRYRPVDIRRDAKRKDLETTAGNTFYGQVVSRDVSRLRMLIQRDTMRMEMPDRITDLLYGPTQLNAIGFSKNPAGVIQYASIKTARSVPKRFGSLYATLQNSIAALQLQEQSVAFQFRDVNQKRWENFVLSDLSLTPLASGTCSPFSPVASLWIEPSSPPAGWQGGAIEWERSIQPSELLYLMVSVANYGGSSALELFRPSEIGDPDLDGLLEFVDAWGNAIQWIRWPAGYSGSLVAAADADAFDPVKTDWRFRSTTATYFPKTLVPLIVSGGADESFGLKFTLSNAPTAYALMTWPQNPDPPYGTGNSLYYDTTYYYPDPYACESYGIPNGSNQIGCVLDDTATDNVTNHDLILEP